VTGRGDSEPVGKGDRVKDQKLAPYSHTSQLIHPSSHEEPQSCIIPVYDDSTTSRYRGTRAPGGQRAWQKPPGQPSIVRPNSCCPSGDTQRRMVEHLGRARFGTQPLTLRGERRGMRCDPRNIYKSLGVRGTLHLSSRGSPACRRGNPQAVARGGRDDGTPLAVPIGISMRVFVIDRPPRRVHEARISRYPEFGPIPPRASAAMALYAPCS
jgi:hypothetical protein